MSKYEKLAEEVHDKIAAIWIEIHRVCTCLTVYNTTFNHLQDKVSKLEKAIGIEDNQAGYYQVWLDCSNCCIAVQVNIPRSKSVAQYRRDSRHKCPKCGCKFAKKVE